jgi:ubiquinone/menaquinone biosynthesis C-methylase UbiE
MKKRQMIGKDYYDYGRKAGVDLNFYGQWQRNYAKTIVQCVQIQKGKSFLDFGTGCGLIVRAIKELSIFDNCYGVDINSYLIDLGVKSHKLSNEELRVCDIYKEALPFPDGSITFLHSSQVLEHIEEEFIDTILKEFKRVLSKDGCGFIHVAAGDGGVDEEPTHLTLKKKPWWDEKFKKYFNMDESIVQRFKDCPISVSKKIKNNFYKEYGHAWYVYGINNKPLE